MSGNLRSGLIAGLIASVIWMLIATAVDMGKAPVIIGGLAFLAGTWLVTSVVAAVITRSRRRMTGR